jgi:undecaprenyl diphosphate synthase
MTDKTRVNMQKYWGLHVAVIMDGNGRWATRQGRPRFSGHRAGVMTAKRIVQRAVELGLGRLTLYAFSSDNWRRPAAEVHGIFGLLRIFLRREIAQLRQNNVRFEVIGRRDRLPETVLREIEAAEASTCQGTGLHLCIAIDYSSREAIAAAAEQAALAVSDGQAISPGVMRSIVAETLAANGGDVDLLIRTGGEKRLSDFLLWESAYAELVFTDRMWPEFREGDLETALEEFSRRQRRFGAVHAVDLAGGALRPVSA